MDYIFQAHIHRSQVYQDPGEAYRYVGMLLQFFFSLFCNILDSICLSRCVLWFLSLGTYIRCFFLSVGVTIALIPQWARAAFLVAVDNLYLSFMLASFARSIYLLSFIIFNAVFIKYVLLTLLLVEANHSIVQYISSFFWHIYNKYVMANIAHSQKFTIPQIHKRKAANTISWSTQQHTRLSEKTSSQAGRQSISTQCNLPIKCLLCVYRHRQRVRGRVW